MKKLFLFPLIGLGLIGSLSWMHSEGKKLQDQEVADCNAGIELACDEVIDALNWESLGLRVENPYFKKKFSKKLIAKQKAEAEVKKWQPKGNNVTMLAFDCSQKNIKPFLKDPNSFREIKTGMSELTDTHVTVWVNYTATNGFGGRVQDTKTCRYTR